MQDIDTNIYYKDKASELTSFRIDALRYISWPYIFWLLIAIGICVVVYELWGGAPLASVKPSIFVYYLILGIHVLFRIKTSGHRVVLYPDMLFLIMYTMFHLGYVTLYGIGLIPYDSQIFFYEASIPKALFIVNLGLVSFLMGYEILGGIKTKPRLVSNPEIPLYSWQIAGAFCITIALCMHLAVLLNMDWSLIQRYGYAALQNMERYTGSFTMTLLWSNSVRVMVLGVLIYTLTSAFRTGKLFENKVVLGLVIFYTVLVTLEGDRGPLVQTIIPLLLVRHYFIKPFKIRYLILSGFAALMFLGALIFVRSTIFAPTAMLEEYQYQKSTGMVTWMSPFLEAGHSFLITNIVANDVPSKEPYWLGASWRDAIFHIIPFFQGFALKMGWATWGPSTWITTTYFGAERAGRAFTISSEGYLNFGFLGVFLELFASGVAVRLLSVKFSQKPSAARGIIMIGVLGILSKATRGHLNLVLNSSVQIILISWFLSVILGSEAEFDEHRQEINLSEITDEESQYADTNY